MGSSSRSKIKLTGRKSIMKSKGINSYCSYAVLGICIACLPLLVAGARRDQRLARREPINEPDLQAAESQSTGNVQRIPQHMASQSAPVPTAAVPPPAAIGPPPSPPLAAAASDQSFSTFASPFPGFPKSDLSSSPSYAPRYAMPPSDPWRENFPFEVANFRRRAQQDEEAPPEDDYKPSESKRKKHGSSIFKRFGSLIRNTGKAIVGAPSYIYKRYRGSWKKVGGGGGGGKKKKGGWKSWSQSDKDKNDGYGGWEEVEQTGGYDHEPSQYPSDQGWKSGKGYSKGYDSHERRYDRDSNHRDYRDREYRERDRDYRDDYKDYKDYKDYDNYRSPPPSSRPRDRQSKYNSPNSYREETHYDDYDGRRTTAYYGQSSRKSPPSSKRPYVSGGGSGSGKSGSPTRYDDEY